MVPISIPPPRRPLSRSAKISSNTLELRSQLWPELDENDLWTRKTKKGFTTIPRPMSIILHIVDDLSKGKPLSTTYLALWCWVFDESMVTIDNPREMAFEVGFSGQRAEATWMSRMKILAGLGFIDIKRGPSGPYNYVLILNPFKVIKGLYSDKKIPELSYISLFKRAQKVGANDLYD